jgi:hypothetical protein
MRWRTASTRSRWWALAGAGVTLATALAGRTRIDPWLFGALLLIVWGLLAYGLSVLRVARPLRLLLTATLLGSRGGRVELHVTAAAPPAG